MESPIRIYDGNAVLLLFVFVASQTPFSFGFK